MKTKKTYAQSVLRFHKMVSSPEGEVGREINRLEMQIQAMQATPSLRRQMEYAQTIPVLQKRIENLRSQLNSGQISPEFIAKAEARSRAGVKAPPKGSLTEKGEQQRAQIEAQRRETGIQEVRVQPRASVLTPRKEELPTQTMAVKQKIVVTGTPAPSPPREPLRAKIIGKTPIVVTAEPVRPKPYSGYVFEKAKKQGKPPVQYATPEKKVVVPFDVNIQPSPPPVYASRRETVIKPFEDKLVVLKGSYVGSVTPAPEIVYETRREKLGGYLVQMRDLFSQQASRARIAGKSGIKEEAKRFGASVGIGAVGMLSPIKGAVQAVKGYYGFVKRGEYAVSVPAEEFIGELAGSLAVGYGVGKLLSPIVSPAFAPRVKVSGAQLQTGVATSEGVPALLKAGQKARVQLETTSFFRELIGQKPKTSYVEIVTTSPPKTVLSRVGGVSGGGVAKVKTGFKIQEVSPTGKLGKKVGVGQQRITLRSLEGGNIVSGQTDVLKFKQSGKVFKVEQQQFALLKPSESVVTTKGSVTNEFQRAVGFSTKVSKPVKVGARSRFFTTQAEKTSAELPSKPVYGEGFAVKTRKIGEITTPTKLSYSFGLRKGKPVQIEGFTGGTLRQYLSVEGRMEASEVQKRFESVGLVQKRKVTVPRVLAGKKAQFMVSERPTGKVKSVSYPEFLVQPKVKSSFEVTSLKTPRGVVTKAYETRLGAGFKAQTGVSKFLTAYGAGVSLGKRVSNTSKLAFKQVPETLELPKVDVLQLPKVASVTSLRNEQLVRQESFLQQKQVPRQLQRQVQRQIQTQAFLTGSSPAFSPLIPMVPPPVMVPLGFDLKVGERYRKGERKVKKLKGRYSPSLYGSLFEVRQRKTKGLFTGFEIRGLTKKFRRSKRKK